MRENISRFYCLSNCCRITLNLFLFFRRTSLAAVVCSRNVHGKLAEIDSTILVFGIVSGATHLNNQIRSDFSQFLPIWIHRSANNFILFFFVVETCALSLTTVNRKTQRTFSGSQTTQVVAYVSNMYLLLCLFSFHFVVFVLLLLSSLGSVFYSVLFVAKTTHTYAERTLSHVIRTLRSWPSPMSSIDLNLLLFVSSTHEDYRRLSHM